jgi:hypothetical protein
MTGTEPKTTEKSVPYEHTQYAKGTMVLLALIALAAAGLAYMAGGDYQLPLTLIALSLLLFVALQMYALKVTVDDRAVRLSFGAGLVRKTFPLENIITCEPVHNSPWLGWGVKWFPGGWLYNVDGLEAVELEMKNAGLIRIGTDEPDKLQVAILKRIHAMFLS